MPLPTYVSEHFELDRATPNESEWYGPINTLLGYLFPPQQYEVAPQCKGLDNPGSTDLTILYVVSAGQGTSKHPVCFFEIKPAGHLQYRATRAAADGQLRERFGYLVDILVIPKLYGISTIGSRFAVYEYDRASETLTPHEIARNAQVVNDTAPETRWAHDFLDGDAGEARLLEVAQDIRTMCAAL
ncbi:hypothetical protein GGX14DRAFT_610390 [Mycena pura]|uniref:Uncharacterized protein n=1 Tax=Mycena pura TaxID=153505 RepID=A0AAD6XZ01_9AGAR|nr:hypothetical protein GGX14DRAFT_610390 [Mycena pura]